MNVIAEVGSCWKSINDCHESISLAKLSGAHFVKFQLFTPNSLYGPNEKFDISQLGVSPYLHPHWLPHLAQQARHAGIEFMCTAFSPREYELVNQEVNYHKIASAEMTDINILKKVNSFRKPVFLSTGGSSIEEIKSALEYLKDCDVTVMYCVADYPAKLIDFNYFKRMQFEIGEDYDFGYSDHSNDMLNIPVLAKSAGASVIEKHVNFCNTVDTNDAGHSCSFNEFGLMMKRLNNEDIGESALYLGNRSMRNMWKRRFVSTSPIELGERFRMGINMNILRATLTADDAVDTFKPWDLEGKRSNRQMKSGETICYHNIDYNDRES